MARRIVAATYSVQAWDVRTIKHWVNGTLLYFRRQFFEISNMANYIFFFKLIKNQTKKIIIQKYMSTELKSRVFIIVRQARAEPSGKVFTLCIVSARGFFVPIKGSLKGIIPLFSSPYISN